MNNVPFTYEADDDIEVELASPWLRIAAALINSILLTIAMIPMIIGMVAAMMQFADDGGGLENLSDEQAGELVMQMFGSSWFLIGALILLAFGILQCVMMSKSGQSIGKKLLNIKIIRENGDEGGFVYNVLVREIAYNIMVSILGYLASLPLHSNPDVVVNIISYGAMLVCIIMMFAARERRTLQDMLAGTVVVQLPPKRAKLR